MFESSEIIEKRKLVAFDWTKLLFIVFIFQLYTIPSRSKEVSFQYCDEVPVTLIVEHFGRTELPSFLCGETIYFSVTEFFRYLQVKNTPSGDFTVVEGFLKDQHDVFRVDHNTSEILYGKKVHVLSSEDLIRTRTGLFLKAEQLKTIFGFDYHFSPRNLSATIKPNFELPVVKVARRERMRENIRQLNGDILADTTVSRERRLFHVGTGSWNFNSTQRTDGFNYSRLNLGLGGVLAGGEFTGNLNFNSGQEFSPRHQFYQWRYVNNSNPYFRQITVGKVAVKSVATIYNPVVGVQLTNAPTYIKRSFGSYSISDFTQPDWIVELYINNILIDYVQADSSGYFSFEVPLTYGSTDVNFRFYGPWGEEEVSERNFNIPHNFLTPGNLEYNLTSGVVEDGENSRFLQVTGNYGLSGFVTIGGGVEYLSSLEKNPVIPFLNGSVRLPGSVLLSGEYQYQVGYNGKVSFTSPSNIRLGLSYKKYEERQEAVRFSYQEERKADLSFPLVYNQFTGTTRFSFRQYLLMDKTFTNIEWMLSGRILGLRVNLNNIAFFQESRDPLLFNKFSTSIRLPGNFNFSPKIEYEFLENRINSVEAQLRKQIFKKINLQSSYYHNFHLDEFNFNLGLSFDLGFTRIGLNSSTSRMYNSFSESASGSMIIEPSRNYLKLQNKMTIGRGSLQFVPFLDINSNGLMDSFENQVDGVGIFTTGGGFREQVSGGGIIFHGLEPYIPYHFKLDSRNLQRIAWQLDYESINVEISPNQVRVIEVPIKVLGEVSGFVYEEQVGLGGIRINILNSEENLITTIISEGDGYFSYLGLPSGKYVARVDEKQLKNLKMNVRADYYFEIKNSHEGDFIDNVEFFLMQEKNI